ncbi:uncharacterized protein LOC135128161 [Zophobas morio]|uniref:uncharacterized protein LOC135128161 n=1 Tax=Zophobas morio TaxID=2755281 RepID=UPI003083B8CB
MLYNCVSTPPPAKPPDAVARQPETRLQRILIPKFPSELRKPSCHSSHKFACAATLAIIYEYEPAALTRHRFRCSNKPDLGIIEQFANTFAFRAKQPMEVFPGTIPQPFRHLICLATSGRAHFPTISEREKLDAIELRKALAEQVDVGGFGFACKTDKLRLITSKLVPEGEARTLDDIDVCVKPIKTLRGFRRKKVHQSVTRTDTWEMKGSGGEIKLVCELRVDVGKRFSYVSRNLIGKLRADPLKIFDCCESAPKCSDSNGKVYTCRALLDQGSQQHLITEEMCKRLHLTTKSVHAGISSVCGSYNEIKHATTLHFKSLHDNYTGKIACLVVPNINRNYPIDTFDKSEIPVPQNLNLADPNYNISSPIDILIGAALFWELLRDGRMKLSNEQTFLHNTCLGWILGGPFTAAAIQINSIFCGNLNTCALEHLDKQVTKFWEVENYDNRIENLSSEDQLCENLFVKQHSRDPNGKFIVRLPFKANPPNLGSTKEIAYKRFRSLEKKFENNYEFRNQYCTFMADYIALNHMQLATDHNIHEGCFLPHHGVIKDSSLTTKVRAVFDASTKSSSGFSLNDYLLPGQNLQTDIFSLLVRSRQYQFVLSADIVKMFRQIWVAPDDWKYKKVLWRSNPDEPIRIYCLKTVSYGMACAPYLAMRCLRQLAVETADSYPHASRVILEDFYMDDLLTGTNDETEAITLRDNLINILGSGGFEITKWASNNDALLPQCHSDNTALVRLDENMQTKTLGLSWDCANDNLKYDFKLQHPIKITKRSVLSTIATVYDPIGILGPVLVSAKLILQKLWQLQSDWDDELPPELNKQFEHFLAELQHVNEIQIPRKVVADYPYQKIQIHGFSDASTKAYGAAVYIRTTDISNSHTVKLLCSKTRVAPIKQITLPRLELCAATLLAKLMSKVKNAMKINFDDCYLWSDSTIALSWIAASPNRWQTFVANRVSEIQTLTNNCKWRHVISNENPADIISRGMDPSELKSCDLWWHGPSFLTKDLNEWPVPKSVLNNNLPEERKISLVSHCTSDESSLSSLFTRVSTYKRLKRIVAYCYRFINKLQKKQCNYSGELSVEELDAAHINTIKLVQKDQFSSEIKELQSNGFINNNSHLKSLNIFMDDNGILRVGGRLQNAKINYDMKHQILLPKNHYVTKIIIRDAHTDTLHAGTQATLAAVRRQFWPVCGKTTIKKIIHNCVKCRRVKPITYEQLMGNLPFDRVNPSRPFSNCGVDYAGPIMIKEGRGRGKRSIKCYVVVFVCLVTKAIHLDLVLDYTSQSFLNCLKRMISRRGKILHMYSDNGTNFVGANRELKYLKKLFDSDEFQRSVIDNITEQGIKWQFIPPNSPHMGGIWEAGVKSFKHHYKRIAGTSLLTAEEMYTLLTQIESILNSRPLTPLSNDPNDLEPLTPGHFLIGSALTDLPEPCLLAIKENRLTRWQRVEQLRQTFWRRWTAEYLTQLQPRNRWSQRNANSISKGSMVVLRDENTPPLMWRLGRVVELHPGKDNVVRVVSLKTSSGVVKRAVNRICVLPVDEVVD